jgi:ribosomal protein L16 Arg81 hydroxylase
MLPPDVPPPGVFPSEDGSEVTSPVSIFEWFTNYYDQLQDWSVKAHECVVHPGEVIFVPSGWWHIVLNLDECFAITQNYVSRRNIIKV